MKISRRKKRILYSFIRKMPHYTPFHMALMETNTFHSEVARKIKDELQLPNLTKEKLLTFIKS